jgi:AraC-like DNA-binding protein
MGTGASQLKNLSERGEPASDYREFLPPMALRESVLCLWTQSVRSSQPVYAHRVLPDACVDLVFFQGQPPAVIGPWTAPFVVQLAPGTRILGARFRPGRAADVLRLPANELLNQQTPIDNVWNIAACSPFAGVGEQRTFRATRAALEGALSRHLRSVTASDAAVSAGIQWLARHPGGRMEQLSRLIGISSRQMQRRFSAAVGYGPKTFQSVLRFQRLLFLASNGAGQQDLADLAARTGYADQSHMTREVQRFAGTPPRELLSCAGCALRLADFLAPGGAGEIADFAA